MERFAIGQPVRRTEDPRFLKGRGRFLNDVVLPGQAYGFVVRSPFAHARVRSIDAEAAKAAPGVLAVLTGAELQADGIGPLRCEAAGLQRGDWITIVGDVALNGPAEQLVDIIGSSRPGDELRIKYERDGQEMSVVVTLGKDSETSLTKLGIRYKTPMPMFVDENMKKLLGDHRGQYRLPPIKPGAARYHRL